VFGAEKSATRAVKRKSENSVADCIHERRQTLDVRGPLFPIDDGGLISVRWRALQQRNELVEGEARLADERPKSALRQ
jgi:hypothetical protein